MNTINTVQLCPVSGFTSSTTSAQVREYLLSIANILCDKIGLEIIPSLTVEDVKGGAYYLGITSTDEHPLLMVCNPFMNTTYWYQRVAISPVSSSLYPYSQTSFNFGNLNTGRMLATTSYAYNLSYITNGNYSAFDAVTAGSAVANLLFIKDRCTDTTNNTFDICGFLYANCLSPSYSPALNNLVSESFPCLNGKADMLASVGLEYDIVLDWYVNGSSVTNNIKRFTNRASYVTNSVITINDTLYLVLYFSSPALLSLLLPITQ